MAKRSRRKILPSVETLQVHDDDLRARYEEILRLREELNELLDGSKPSPAQKKEVERRKLKGWRFN
jgi:hypothetical protein